MRPVDDSERLVKVIVRLEPDGERETEHWWAESEALWAFPVGEDTYELRSIPWETDTLHHRDIVRCRTEDGSATRIRPEPSPPSLNRAPRRRIGRSVA